MTKKYRKLQGKQVKVYIKRTVGGQKGEKERGFMKCEGISKHKSRKWCKRLGAMMMVVKLITGIAIPSSVSLAEEGDVVGDTISITATYSGSTGLEQVTVTDTTAITYRELLHGRQIRV